KPLSPSSSQIDPGSDRGLTFAGIVDVTVPAGAEYISDPIDYAVAPLSNLAVTFHLDSPPVIETSHPGSRSTSYYTHGDLVSAPDLPPIPPRSSFSVIRSPTVTVLRRMVTTAGLMFWHNGCKRHRQRGK